MRELIKGNLISSLYYHADNRRDCYDSMNEQLQYFEIRPDLLFFGDSITENWEVSFAFGKYGNVVNRGIGGDCIYGASCRFDADVLQWKPRVCVCMLGVNDFSQGIELTARETFAKGNDAEIVAAIDQYIAEKALPLYEEMLKKALRTGIKFLVCSVMPVRGNRYANEYIKRWNNELLKLAKKYETEYVDYYSAVQDGKGDMAQEYTWDGVHPIGKGYAVMARVLNPYLEKSVQGGL